MLLLLHFLLLLQWHQQKSYYFLLQIQLFVFVSAAAAAAVAAAAAASFLAAALSALLFFANRVLEIPDIAIQCTSSAWAPAGRGGSVWLESEYLQFDFLRVATISAFRVGNSPAIGTAQVRVAKKVRLEASEGGPGGEFAPVGVGANGMEWTVPDALAKMELAVPVRARAVRIRFTEIDGNDAYPFGLNR